MSGPHLLNLSADRKLRLYDQHLDWNAKQGEPVQAFAHYERVWYGSSDLYQMAQIVLSHWVEPHEDQRHFHDHLCDAFAGIWDAGRRNGLTADCRKIYTSRRERWQRVCKHLNIRFPDNFLAWRTVRDAEDGERLVHIPDIIRSWKGAEEYVAVPQKELASWSLCKEIPERHLRAATNGVMYKAAIPFELTLFDKLADDGPLVRNSQECELVAGFREPGAIIAPKIDVIVRLMGRFYTYRQAEQLVEMYTRHCE